jgi:hemerythrin-like domain-containing protein
MATTSILEQLKNEHDDIKKLFKKAEESRGYERTEIVRQLKKEILPHARSEEKTIYTLLKESLNFDADSPKDDINLALEAFEEHRVIEKLLQDLEGININHETWPAHLTVLKENIEHHIEEEEKKLFKLIKKHFSKEKLEELKTLYIMAKNSYDDTLPTQEKTNDWKPYNDIDFA